MLQAKSDCVREVDNDLSVEEGNIWMRWWPLKKFPSRGCDSGRNCTDPTDNKKKRRLPRNHHLGLVCECVCAWKIRRFFPPRAHCACLRLPKMRVFCLHHASLLIAAVKDSLLPTRSCGGNFLVYTCGASSSKTTLFVAAFLIRNIFTRTDVYTKVFPNLVWIQTKTALHSRTSLPSAFIQLKELKNQSASVGLFAPGLCRLAKTWSRVRRNL